MKKISRKIAVLLLSIISIICLAGGLAACAPKGPVDTPDDTKSVRYKTPDDGSKPTAYTALQNVGYLAYTLDNQPSYTAYAYNSSKSMGYEQITQTWKDYKSEALTGYAGGVMICSDLTYSTFVRAGTQACFVNGGVYMRASSQPGKTTTATTASWNTTAPTYYERDAYLLKYGEYSTELSVYLINGDTIASSEEIVLNDDGTYSLTVNLNSSAGYYYQYGMKTRGGLKGYPEFKSIKLTFTFDESWRILETYCEETTKIAPSALAGISMDSTSKTTTTFSYADEDFDNVHFGYFDSYYKQYLGSTSGRPDDGKTEPDFLSVLGGGFSKVVDPNGNGQQFVIDFLLGETEYTGKIYLQLTDMSDVLGSLDARVALGKKDGGRQDLYIEFSDGKINVYYSDDFALGASVDGLQAVVNQFSEWLARFENPSDTDTEAPADGAEEEEKDLLSGLLEQFGFVYDDDSATVSLVTDDLLGTGIGAEVYLDFDREVGSDGDSYAFTGATLGSITYSGSGINFSASISPDNDGAAIIERNPSETSANLSDYASDLFSMLNSETLEVKLTLDGTQEGVLSYLNGIKADATAYLVLGSEIATRVDMTVEYSSLSVKLSAYYSVGIYSGGYGTVYLKLTEVCGTAMNAGVYCNVDETLEAVTALLGAINGYDGATAATAEEQPDEEQINSTAKLINNILALNFSEIFGEIYASNSQIRVSADIDKIITGLGVDVGGFTFGTAALAFTASGENTAANLSLGLPALGLNITVAGSEISIEQPDEDDYLDLTSLIELVTKATEEVNKIIANSSAAFSLDTTVTADGVAVSVKGDGEADWSGDLRLALDLELYISDGTTSSAKDKLALKLVFDDSIKDDTQPFVRLAINNLGLNIYRGDVTETKNGIENLVAAINNLLGNTTDTPASTAVAVTVGSEQDASSADVTQTLTQILESENVQQILKTILSVLSDASVELGSAPDGEEINSLVISYATCGKLTLAADGKLSLSLEAETDAAQAEVYASVAASTGFALGAKLNEEFAGEDENGVKNYTFYDAGEAEQTFVKLVYNYLFAVIEDLSVENVLGDKTYEIALAINGDDSGIAALAGVNVQAKLYYTQGLSGETVTKDKLMEADIALDIGGTEVALNARFAGEYLYITLGKVGATTLGDINVKADVHDIYSAVEQVVEILTNPNLTEIIGNLGAAFTLSETTSASAVTEATAAEEPVAEEQTQSALTTVISALLTFDFSEAFGYTKVDGVITATINVSYILPAFGITDIDVGTLTVNVNTATHAVTAEVNNGTVWANLSAQVTDRRVYADNWQDNYTDISFVSTLLSDLNNTMTDDNGNIYGLYTFAGTISADIVSMVTLNIDITSLTFGFDEDGHIYATLLADLDKQTLLTYTVTEDWNIGVTFTVYNGKPYIVIGRELGTESQKFKVMTLEFFIDNMLSSDNSPLRWMLGTSSGAWKLIMNALGGSVNLDSGLTKPQTYTLYEELQQALVEGNFSLSDYINGFAVNFAGETVSTFGNGENAANKLGISSDYYAFDVAAGELTGGVLTELYAAILRRADESGAYYINGIKAYAAISSYLKFTLNLDEYLEGVTDIYGATLLGFTAASPTEDEFYDECTDITEFADGQTYYVYDETNGYSATEEDFSSEETYYVFSNGTYYVGEDGSYELATSYDGSAQYYEVEQTANYAQIGKTAGGNYLDYVIENYAPDFNYNGYAAGGEHTSPIFGCYSTETNGYEASYVLEPVTLTVIGLDGETELEVELRYGSTVNLINTFSPKWADDTHIIVFADADGELLGESIIICEDTTVYATATEAYGITLNINVAGVKTVQAAVAADAEIPEYPLTGYAFLGWYATSDFSGDKITNQTDGVSVLYGKYLKTEVTVNGVIYTYDKDKDVYSVTGHTDAVSAYSASGSVLVLENELYGVKVTSIGANAFEKAMLKNVVVPENITDVGANAFLDNYGMETIVFAADQVYMHGTVSDKTTVFYGCSTADGGTSSNLKIYYNSLSAEAGNEWSYFRYKSLYYYYIGTDPKNGATSWSIDRWLNGGGELISGGWAYADYEFASGGADLTNGGLECLTYGINTQAISAEELQKNILDELNSRTVSDGYINGYTVSVSGGVTLGKYNKIIITVEEATKWYALSTESSVDICTVSYTAEYSTELNGVTYVMAGSAVTAVAAGDENGAYELVKWVVKNAGGAEVAAIEADDTTYAFGMYEQSVTVKAIWQASYAENVTYVSSIGFVYADVSYAAGTAKLTNAAANAALSVPTADGYTFVGWAVDNNDGTLAAYDGLITKDGELTLYALWVANREELTYTVDRSTLTVSATSNTSGVSVLGWYAYDDESFSNGTSFNTSVTALRARLGYTLTLSLVAENTNWYYTKTNGNNYTDMDITENKTWGIVTSYTVNNGISIGSNSLGFEIGDISEGYSVQVYRYWSNAIVIRIYDGTTCLTTYLIKGQKSNDQGNWRDEALNGTDNWYMFNSSWEMNSDYDKGDYKAWCEYDSSREDITYYFATAKVGSNLSFTAKV